MTSSKKGIRREEIPRGYGPNQGEVTRDFSKSAHGKCVKSVNGSGVALPSKLTYEKISRGTSTLRTAGVVKQNLPIFFNND